MYGLRNSNMIQFAILTVITVLFIDIGNSIPLCPMDKNYKSDAFKVYRLNPELTCYGACMTPETGNAVTACGEINTLVPVTPPKQQEWTKEKVKQYPGSACGMINYIYYVISLSEMLSLKMV